MSPLATGSHLGRFQISGVLGEGAMGLVYLAHDPQIERPVAVKTLRREVAAAELAREIETRFLKEAKLAGRLQHPNIVTIYEVGEDQGVFFIAMEYVDGESLSRFSARHELSLAERVDVVRQVALALQHAHQRGVLHRDIKPGNILLTRDRRVKVADFGIGKLLSGAGDLTRTGQMLGSPAYMSPEQIRGEKLDGRSDFFSLGVVLYELLTGARPFPGDSITTLVYQILHTEPRDPLEIRSDLPASAREVLARLLAKNPARRPADADEFLREVRKIDSGLEESERTLPFPVAARLPEKTVERSKAAPVGGRLERAATPPLPGRAPAERRDAMPAYLFALAVLLLALAAFVVIWRRTEKKSEPAPVPSPAPAVPVAAALPTAAPPETPAPTPGAVPTPGPAKAADAIVGAPRYSGPLPAKRPPRSVAEPARSEAPLPPPDAALPAAPPAPASSSSAPTPDSVYRARHFAKFGVSPDQARIHVDGRYVGIADDWDDHGGGKTFEFTREGVHHVRLELPGYRDLNLDIIVTPSAKDDTADIGDELKRESHVPYPKLSSPTDRTVGPVEFIVDPPEAMISERGRVLGPASSYGPGSPLRLNGPMVHDLVLSAPGRKPKTVRILVAPNADSDRAKVKLELKKE